MKDKIVKNLHFYFYEYIFRKNRWAQYKQNQEPYPCWKSSCFVGVRIC